MIGVVSLVEISGVTTKALVRGGGIISLVAFETIGSNGNMCAFNNPVIIMNIKSCRFPSGNCSMAVFAGCRNRNCGMRRILGLIIVSYVTTAAHIWCIRIAGNVTFRTFHCQMGSGKRILEVVIKSLFTAIGMTRQASRVVVCVSLNPVMFLIHAGFIVIVTIGTGKLRITG